MSVGDPIRIPEPGEGVGFLPGELAAVADNAMLELGAERVEPRCVHFGECGGCQYQHTPYATQVAMKAEVLRRLLEQAGLAALPAISTHTAEEWGYRNRIRLRVRAEAAEFEVGYSRRGSNEFLPVRMCPIAAPLLWQAAETLLELGGSEPLLRRWLEAVAEVELFCNADESRLQMRFLLHDAEPARREPLLFARVCELLQERLPALAGAGAELDPELSRRVRRRWAGEEWGASGLKYEAGGRDYWVSRGAFFQVNRFLVDRLVELVCGGQSGELAWDIFAGVGLFSRVLAERFERVVAVEGADAAAADLAAASKGGRGRAGFTAVQSPALDFLRQHALQRERPGLIVLDPPRAGVGEEAAELLGRIAAPRMVYVSCDPTTLARDLAILTREGLRIDAIDLIDLFPQTYHIETVVHLSRRS